MGRLLDELIARREEVLACLARHRAANPRVFGSVARGEEAEGSDVDLLVQMPGDVSSFEVVRLNEALADLLARRIDLVLEDELHPALRSRVLAEARAL
ncbi:hypothetical protein GPA19_13735 [Azoarcus indigens]|uniref:Polymerase nucleotidyl transferase domain-containing protein n=1 Tax=Azoarcus indigens TaxID=29545 RepID=A0A4R6DQZ7_9RHOO|nr:nucleotidyltransferase domain-containing protein [Azoarcus indigens]NMG66008.1 hypothetical protein [Azoarcus indigens]TDN46899.1 hypothetical protein C7389_12459 [Azoarcus indigens]